MYEFQDKINPGFTYDHPFNKICIYCSSNLEFESVKKISKVPFKLFYKHFLDHVERIKEIHGRFDKKYFQINHSLNYEESHIKRCLQCGLWSSYDEYWVSASWQIWQVFYGVTGVIKKKSIKLEQVRAFLGALTLQGIQKGIYVSTSEFQKGCYDIAKSCSINLFGGNRFYDSLLEAQIIKYSNTAFPNVKGENLYHCGCFELNSL